MIRIVLGVIAAIGFFTLSEALTCNSCKVGILGKCLMSSQVSCAASEPNCYTAKAEALYDSRAQVVSESDMLIVFVTAQMQRSGLSHSFPLPFFM
ncbi:hypothetical protein QQF64_013554 [Cirrhinus molitorella]|uniref:UPAR/Ly6 domain-containing protein n=1 Tax=Cirrhinus molitorella TaxID=172907 RepID=A0ABR3LRK3_9TELE